MARLRKNKLVNDIIEKELKFYGNKYLYGKLIDIGCGIKPYKELLASTVDEHIGVDHVETFHDKDNIDLFGTAYEIPAKNDEFDSALCTFVLEHLEEPDKAINECNRVLKEGAYALYMMPHIWHLHEEPRDFYRYTKYGLAYLFSKNNFEIVEIKPLSGFIVTFGQLFIYYIDRFNYGWLRRLRIITLFEELIQILIRFLHKRDKTYQWTWAYLVLAKKK
jgi:ubiquinone/menaquinone biosynthesis C-methylase UbiE